MKNNNLIIAAVVVIGIIAIAGIGGYMVLGQNNSNDTEKMASENESIEQNTTSDDKMMADENSKMASTSTKYVQYEEGTLDSIEGKKVLFFYADWCPTCRPADAEIQENVSNIPDDITVVRVNYNDSDTDQAEEDLAKDYKITYQHTFVQIDENGEEITRWSGGSFQEILDNIK